MDSGGAVAQWVRVAQWIVVAPWPTGPVGNGGAVARWIVVPRVPSSGLPPLNVPCLNMAFEKASNGLRNVCDYNGVLTPLTGSDGFLLSISFGTSL